ncbi:hypothetical protein B1A99_29790 [Cohnella sp. CIP 111063]|jgi:hypothetical protein|uniref:hypothetical protein n=1 Tax=unclassified Cohnella TaxID=2636738 RepID=UPI000B8BF368|nr:MULTISPECIES: hypothetical protein [unclassified Cohnella]OXS53562.1 hypothetical protein B1A99_29790 [Cohnella sp. CIP 111063]PRX61592.1 hypothetical protein B0G52_125114 [Cohnella sp. SGD-V74]
MRAGIRERLSQQISSIGGRIFEAHESASTLDKPYILLIQGTESTDTDWTGITTLFECWPSAAQQSDFSEVDELSDLIVEALDGQALVDPDSLVEFTCRYEGTVGPDKADADREVITRGLRFSVIGARTAQETVQDDWLDAICDWTLDTLGDSDWQAYSGRWPANYERPSILWRWEGIETVAGSRASTIEVRKKAIGHVVGRTVNEQTMTAAALAQSLSEAVKIPLSLPERRYLTVLTPSVDLARDAMTEGQILVTFSRKIERYAEQGPLMREVNFQPNPNS